MSVDGTVPQYKLRFQDQGCLKPYLFNTKQFSSTSQATQGLWMSTRTCLAESATGEEMSMGAGTSRAS